MRRRSGRIRVGIPEFAEDVVPPPTTRRRRSAAGTPGVTSGRVGRRSRGAPRGRGARTTDRNNNTVSSIESPRGAEGVSTTTGRRSRRSAPASASGGSPAAGNPSGRRRGRPRGATTARNEQPMEVEPSSNIRILW